MAAGRRTRLVTGNAHCCSRKLLKSTQTPEPVDSRELYERRLTRRVRAADGLTIVFMLLGVPLTLGGIAVMGLPAVGFLAAYAIAVIGIRDWLIGPHSGFSNALRR